MKYVLLLSTILSSSLSYSMNSQTTFDPEGFKCSAGIEISKFSVEKKLVKKTMRTVTEVLNKNGYGVKKNGSVDILVNIDFCRSGIYSRCDLVVRNMFGEGGYQAIVLDKRNKSNDEIVKMVTGAIKSFDFKCSSF